MMIHRARIRQFQMSGLTTGSKPLLILRRNEYRRLESIEKVARQTSQPKRLKIVKMLKVNDCSKKIDGHIAQIDPLALYRCDHCAESFLSSQDLTEHTATAHPVAVDFSCDQCTERYQLKSELLQHVAEAHHSLPKINCTTSGDQVTDKFETLDPDGPMSIFHCPACDFVSRSKHSLQSHFVRKHTDRYEHQCKFCRKKFKVKGDLATHMRFQHKEKPIECDVCGKVYKNSGSLYVHQKWAHYKPKFECPICHRRMVTQENLDQHMLVQHEKREKIACAECGKIFTKLSSLKRHLGVHLTNPYKCGICKKDFVLKSDLMNHLSVHNSSRPFSCEICGMAFARRSSLVSHEKSHTPVGHVSEQFTGDCRLGNLPSKSADDAIADGSKEEEDGEKEREQEEEGLEAEYEEQIEEILEILEYKPANPQ